MMCKGKTYIKGVCDKCQHYVTECDPIMKTKFKKAQVVFNNYIFDEVGKLNEFRAKEEALIRRVSALEMDLVNEQTILTTHLKKCSRQCNQTPVLMKSGDIASFERRVNDLEDRMNCGNLKDIVEGESALWVELKTMKESVEWCLNTLNFYYNTLRLHDRVEEDGKNISELRRDVMSMNRRLVDAEAMIVSLQLKLDTCNLKIDYPVDTLKSCDEKRKIGRPKKV